nr:RNA-directed DNA polymerase, eukaryota [Tanacetum cinerariifolium]
EWNQNEIVNIIEVLEEFYQISGLKINIRKSNVSGVGVSNEEIEAMSRFTVCSPGILPFTYLGLPIEAGLDLKGCNSNGVWAKIVGSFNTLHFSGILANDTLKCKVGDEAYVHFWKDMWLSDEPLSIRYNRLFRLDSNEECLIKERLVNGSWSWSWKRPITSGRTRSSLMQLMHEVSQLSSLSGIYLIHGNG